MNFLSSQEGHKIAWLNTRKEEVLEVATWETFQAENINSYYWKCDIYQLINKSALLMPVGQT